SSRVGFQPSASGAVGASTWKTSSTGYTTGDRTTSSDFYAAFLRIGLPLGLAARAPLYAISPLCKHHWRDVEVEPKGGSQRRHLSGNLGMVRISLRGRWTRWSYAARRTERRYSASAAISTSLVVTLLRSAHLATSDHTSIGTPATARWPINFKNDFGSCLDFG